MEGHRKKTLDTTQYTCIFINTWLDLNVCVYMCINCVNIYINADARVLEDEASYMGR